jgi:hypothetical protein
VAKVVSRRRGHPNRPSPHPRYTPHRFDISACPNDALALTSRLVVSAADDYGTHEYVRVKGQYVLAIM